ncbi:unnamed protein product [Closterium sp. NIES-54]
MYRLSKSDDYILLIVYVDDLLYIGSNDDITTWFEGELQQDLTLTVSSTVTQYLGLNIREEEDAIYINAAKYADTIAKRFAITPTAISTPYRYTTGKEGSVLLKPAGIRNYQKKLGCLLFAAVTCRPDLSYSASQLATYLKKPETEHLAELDRALHYFVSTPMIGLTYYKNATTPTELVGYVDADHAGDTDNRRSRTGYIYRLEPIGPISWQSTADAQQLPSAPVAPVAPAAQVAMAAGAAHATDAEHTPAPAAGPSRQRHRRRTAISSSDATATPALIPDQVNALLSLLQQQPVSVTATETALRAASASAKKENAKRKKAREEQGRIGTTTIVAPPAPAADNDTDDSEDEAGEAPVNNVNFNGTDHHPPLPSSNLTFSAATFVNDSVREQAELLGTCVRICCTRNTMRSEGT